jgi:hypothetical protein
VPSLDAGNAFVLPESVEISDLLSDSFHKGPGFNYGNARVAPWVVADVVGDEEVTALLYRTREVNNILRIGSGNQRQRVGILNDLNGPVDGLLQRPPKLLKGSSFRDEFTEVPVTFLDYLL